jgi:hypothetical protein
VFKGHDPGSVWNRSFFISKATFGADSGAYSTFASDFESNTIFAFVFVSAVAMVSDQVPTDDDAGKSPRQQAKTKSEQEKCQLLQTMGVCSLLPPIQSAQQQ